MIKSFLTFCNHNHWYVIAFFLYTILILWGLGCQPKCESLIEPGKKISVPELQNELDFLANTAAARVEEINRQQELKADLLNLAALVAEQGGVNYTGLFSALAAIGGIAFGLDRNYKLKRANNQNTTTTPEGSDNAKT